MKRQVEQAILKLDCRSRYYRRNGRRGKARVIWSGEGCPIPLWAELMETTMTTLEEKNELEVMVLTDLAAIWKKLAENSALREELRVQARQLVKEFNSILPYRGKGTHFQHYEGENLLIRMARLLPSVLEIGQGD